MRMAETVTFGGSGLDRAALLRGKAAPGSVLAIWRGKPLMQNESLMWLDPGSPALAHGAPPIFLGMDDGIPRHAQDISDWTPETEEAFHPALPPDAAFAELRGVMATLSVREAELAATGKALVEWHRSHRFCATCGAQSQPASGGWQRDCPACGAHHFPRTDPVVIMLILDDNRLLLGRSPGWPDRMYSCLAGFVEPGEPVEAAVRREVLEETGIRVGEVRYLASQPWPFPASLMLGCLGQAISRDITVDPNEIEDALWVTREEMLEALCGTHPRIDMPREGSIARFLISSWLADRLD